MGIGGTTRARRAAVAALVLVLSATALAGCSGSEDGGRTPQEWYDRHGEAWFEDFAALEQQAAAVSGDLAATRSFCTHLGELGAAARDLPDIPDEEIEARWQIAASNLDSVARSCLDGIDRNDPAYLRMTVDLIMSAATELQKVLDLIGFQAPI